MDPAKLAHADQLLAQGAEDFERLLDQVRVELARTDPTRATMAVVGWVKADPEDWDRDALMTHFAVAMVRLAQVQP